MSLDTLWQLQLRDDRRPLRWQRRAEAPRLVDNPQLIVEFTSRYMLSVGSLGRLDRDRGTGLRGELQSRTVAAMLFIHALRPPLFLDPVPPRRPTHSTPNAIVDGSSPRRRTVVYISRTATPVFPGRPSACDQGQPAGGPARSFVPPAVQFDLGERPDHCQTVSRLRPEPLETAKVKWGRGGGRSGS